MNQELIDSSMQILIHSGDARRDTYQAIAAIEHGDFDLATGLLDTADQHIRDAHQVHTSLIQLEAGGERLEYAALFSHAQDTLMTTYSELRLVHRLVPLFRTYNDRLSALEAHLHD